MFWKRLSFFAIGIEIASSFENASTIVLNERKRVNICCRVYVSAKLGDLRSSIDVIDLRAPVTPPGFPVFLNRHS